VSASHRRREAVTSAPPSRAIASPSRKPSIALESPRLTSLLASHRVAVSRRPRDGVASPTRSLANANVRHRFDLVSRWRRLSVASRWHRVAVAKASRCRRVGYALQSFRDGQRRVYRRVGIASASPCCRRRVPVVSAPPLQSRRVGLAVASATRLFCVPSHRNRVAVLRRLRVVIAKTLLRHRPITSRRHRVAVTIVSESHRCCEAVTLASRAIASPTRRPRIALASPRRRVIIASASRFFACRFSATRRCLVSTSRRRCEGSLSRRAGIASTTHRCREGVSLPSRQLRVALALRIVLVSVAYRHVGIASASPLLPLRSHHVSDASASPSHRIDIA
jgi:hypothetical protein